jgi:hypothetical protein
VTRRATLSPAWRARAEQRRQERISDLQRILGHRSVTCQTRRDYLRQARWWALEASRDYGHRSSSSAECYARNMRWAAELAALHGPGTWLELIGRAGVAEPEAGGLSG